MRTPSTSRLFSVSRNPWVALAALTCALLAGLAAAPPAVAAEAGTTCFLNFELKSWSFFYKSTRGEGEIACDNGQRATVLLRGRGGGLTFGKSRIIDGNGSFTDVADITDLFGAYAQASATGTIARGGEATVLTKGPVSLALAGKGRGADVGLAFGRFKIEPVTPIAQPQAPVREYAVPTEP